MNWHILLAKQSNERCTAEPWLLVILVAETLLSFYASSFPSILQVLWNLNIFLASGPPLPHRTHTLCHIKFKGHESIGDILKFACNLCPRFRMSIWMPQLQQQFNWVYAKFRFLPIYSKTTLSLPTCLVLGLKDPPQSCGTCLGGTRWHISTNRKTLP